MRRTGITILLLLYAFIQLGTIAFYYADPVIHAICYDLLRSRIGNQDNIQDAGICTLHMDLNTYRKVRRDEQEIYWNRECYDLKSITITGNNVTLHAVKDWRETCWVTAAENLLRRVTGNPLPGKAPDTRFCQWLFKLYVPTERLPSLTRFQTRTHGKGFLCQSIPLLFPDLPAQPPDRIS